MRLAAFILSALSVFASDFTGTANFTFQATPVAAVVHYTVPGGDSGTVCTWEWSESNTYSPLVNDVDTTLFSGSNADNRAGSSGAGTTSRTFVLGQGGTGINYAPLGSDGIRYSRALRVSTTHYGRVTCGSDFATASFATSAPGGNPTNSCLLYTSPSPRDRQKY